MLEERNVKATCFFLGYTAQRHPHLIKRAAAAGHEVASHGYHHELVYKAGRMKFLEDAKASKALLEDLLGGEVKGYRAAGFSVTRETPWFFDALIEAGYRYDSSVFPGPRQHGGMAYPHSNPHWVRASSGAIFEIPISLFSLFGRKVCFSGGGYLRLLPYWLIRSLARQVMRSGDPVTFYVHPRDFDVEQPRIRMGPLRAFKSYVGLRSTERKVRALLGDFQFARYDEYLARSGAAGSTASMLSAQAVFGT